MSDRFKFISDEITEIIDAIKDDLEIKNAATTTEITKIDIKNSEPPYQSKSKIYKDDIIGTTTINYKGFGIDLSISYDKKIYAKNAETIKARLKREVNNAALKYEALHDSKTGAMIEGQIVKILSKSNKNISVIFCDLDKFKQINDSHSYDAGDSVITDFYKNILSCASITFENNKREFYITRMGGEEFILYAADATSQEIASLSQSILTSAQNARVEFQGETIKYTTSIGVCEGLNNQNIQEIRDRAELSVKAAKRTGRNKIINFPEIKRNCGRVLENIGGLIAIDIGKKCQVSVRDKFFVYHPSCFDGESVFTTNDGRSEKILGNIPKYNIATIQVISTNDEVSFCKILNAKAEISKDYCLENL